MSCAHSTAVNQRATRTLLAIIEQLFLLDDYVSIWETTVNRLY